MTTSKGFDRGLLLVGPARRLLDMWQSLDELGDKPDDLARLLIRWLHDALDADPNLSTAEVQQLKQAAQVHSDDTVSFDAASMRIDCERVWFDDVSLPLWDEKALGGEPPMLLLRPHVRWRIRPRPKTGERLRTKRNRPHQASTPVELSDHSRSCLQLVYDYFCLTMHEKLLGHNPMPRPNQCGYTSVSWRFPNGKRAEVPWAGPVFDTFWEANRFALAWKAVVHEYDDQRVYLDAAQPITDVLGVNWIAVATGSLVGGKQPRVLDVEYTPWVREAFEIDEEEWANISLLHGETDIGHRTGTIKKACQALSEKTHELVERYATGKAGSPARAWRAWGWLWNLVVLLAPESGLPKEVANMFFDQSGALADFCRNPIHEPRIRRIRAWLTKSAWGSEDSEKEFEIVTALVNPTMFAKQCTDLLRQVEARAKGKLLPEDAAKVTHLIGLLNDSAGSGDPRRNQVATRCTQLLEKICGQVENREKVLKAELTDTLERILEHSLSEELDDSLKSDLTCMFTSTLRNTLNAIPEGRLNRKVLLSILRGELHKCFKEQHGRELEECLKETQQMPLKATADAVKSAFGEMIDALEKSSVEASVVRPWLEKLQLAKQCVPLWIYSRDHPVNKIEGLCPEASDVPRSARREGLWSVEII